MKNIINNFDIKKLLLHKNVDSSWKEFINQEFKKTYFLKLEKIIISEYQHKIIFPKFENIFKYLELPMSQIKIICIGQDPYHQKNQATGIAFSVANNIKTPPSLRNIFKELYNDLAINKENNSLLNWFKQGFFAINWSLSVEEGKPLSHSKIGWSQWTINLIKYIENHHQNFGYLLWGNFAQKVIPIINNQNRFIIASSHPSPLSAYHSFFGSKPFSQINNFLTKNKIKTINFAI